MADLVEPTSPPQAAAEPGGLKHWLQWRINRLRCMTPLEVAHRVVRLASARAERAGLLGRGAVPAPDLSIAAAPWVHAVAVDPAPYVAAAESIAAGRLDVFALEVALGNPPRWNRDPKTGIEAPLTFGKTLDYRDERVVGDIKYLWEPNRHLQFVTLAQAWTLTRERRWLDSLALQLESWLDACPYPLGPNWASALEPALRLLNWAIAWQLIGGAQSELFADERGRQLRARWLVSVYEHAQFVRGFFSRHSSANNHLIGEAVGLFVASVTWPHWPRARRWRRAAQAILEREALAQNAPDGVNREQAVSYQQYEADLLMLALLAGRANGAPFSAAYQARLEAMLEYLASIIDSGGNPPMFGDSDDGYAVRLSQEPGFCRFRSVLAAGALAFGRGELKAKARTLDDKTRWLFGAGADAAFDALGALPWRLPVRRAFPEGGYWILGADFESEREVRMVVDAGPLGYTAIAAHGHADALSFTLSLGGLEFLIDPGTYAYHTQGPWRRYFRGTSAHNTLRIDAMDQSEQGGNFLWLAKARAHCSHFASDTLRDAFEGWHDGYARLADPVIHRRRITLDKRARRIRIEDSLEMRGAHQVELFFHASEDCRVQASPGGAPCNDYTLRRGARTLQLALPERAGAASRLHVGDIAPIAGWVSRSFDRKQPCATIAWRARIEGSCTLKSELRY